MTDRDDPSGAGQTTSIPVSSSDDEHNISSPQAHSSTALMGPPGDHQDALDPEHPHRASRVEVDHFDPVGVEEFRRSALESLEMLPQPPEEDSGRLDVPEETRRVSESSFSSSSGTAVGSFTLGPPETFSLEKALRDILKRLNNSNIKKRELGVSFQNLRVVGLGAMATYQPTLGSILNPFNKISGIKKILHPAVRDILTDFEGVVRPGEMLLVLGRPGAGCSTLLRVLANQREDYHAVEGDVRYDSFTPEEILHHYRGDLQYSPEDDIHFPSLTVEQTLRFAARLRTPHSRIDSMSREKHIDIVTDLAMTVFGLRHVRNTLVGDASIRGVSGGEKKRVSISEALVSRSLLNCWDNSTRGLDASTALEFVRALRIATNLSKMATIVSIYQAGESLYEQFDKVCVIYDGRMIYYGPADRARQYFIDMGYEPANRQTTADFLVAVTDPNGRTAREGYESRVPRTAEEFVDYFKRSEFGKMNLEDIESYNNEFTDNAPRKEEYIQGAVAEHAKTAIKHSPYVTSIPMQVRALMVRRVQIIQGAYLASAIQIATFILQAIIMGTIFFRLSDSTATYFSRGGVLFFSILFAALSTMTEIPALFAQRPIVLRQSKAAYYHAFGEALAMTLVDVPISFVTIIMFSIVLYFLTDLQRTAGQFFTFFLIVFTVMLTMKAYFRALAASFKAAAPAQGVAGISVLVFSLYTGYSIPMPSMIGALKWITWLNPLRYGFEAIMVNEFHTLHGTCASLVPSGPGYEGITLQNQVCTTVGSVPGQPTVDGNTFLHLSFNYLYSHLWRNFGVLCVFGVGFVTLLLIMTEINNGSIGESSVTLFKRGSHSEIAEQAEKDAAGDEEKGHPGLGHIEDPPEQAKRALTRTKLSSNIFSWHDIRYTVPVGHGKQRLLLDSVSGYVEPGKLTALMGESGAGKTTLLNVLAERQGAGVVEGQRLMDGRPLPAEFHALTGYCQQMDTHLGTTTVREALLFSAKLRQPREVPLEEKEAYVEKCLEICGLMSHADAIVGSLGVEHRKRTTIAVELVAKPSLIFLDEPTSGLDSQSAWAIMNFLRILADGGQSIVCTIHQPSAELFQVFDRLLLLRKGGQTVYFGDIGKRSTTLIDYFERHGSRPCRDNENPAEFILDVIGAGATASSDIDWHDVWKQSQASSTLGERLTQIRTGDHKEQHHHRRHRQTFQTTWFYQMVTLLQRDTLNHWRDPTYLMAKLVLNIAGGLLIGFTFFKANFAIQGTQNHIFAIFMSAIVSIPLTNQLQVIFIQVRTIYEIREQHSRMYHWSALVTSQYLSEVPWNILGSSIYFLCWYWTVGLPAGREGYTYLFYSVIFPIYYTSFGQAVAAMAPDANIAGLIFSFIVSFPITMSGVLQPYRELGWWQWVYRISPYTYLIEGLLGNGIGREEITCAAKELVQVNPPSGQTCQQYMGAFISANGGYLTNPNATTACSFCQYQTTDAFLGDSFNIYYSHRWRDLGLFCAFIVFNLWALFTATYIFRIHSADIRSAIRRLLPQKKVAE